MKALLLSSLMFCFILSSIHSNAQKLKPGFDKKEYIELLKIMQKQHVDLDKWETDTSIPYPAFSKFVYRSPVVGLENVWDLWITNDNIAVLSVRGTIAAAKSWVPNLYAAMVPATGTLPSKRILYLITTWPTILRQLCMRAG